MSLFISAHVTVISAISDMDGLRISLRNVLFLVRKRKLTKEIKMAQNGYSTIHYFWKVLSTSLLSLVASYTFHGPVGRLVATPTSVFKNLKFENLLLFNEIYSLLATSNEPLCHRTSTTTTYYLVVTRVTNTSSLQPLSVS